MVASTYGERLRSALELTDVSDEQLVRNKANELATALGISYTGAKKVLDGKSVFSAANSAKAARHVGVEHFWLATGDGTPTPSGPWPFDLFNYEEYMTIPEPYRRRAENDLAGEIQRNRKRNGTK